MRIDVKKEAAIRASNKWQIEYDEALLVINAQLPPPAVSVFRETAITTITDNFADLYKKHYDTPFPPLLRGIGAIPQS